MRCKNLRAPCSCRGPQKPKIPRRASQAVLPGLLRVYCIWLPGLAGAAAGPHGMQLGVCLVECPTLGLDQRRFMQRGLHACEAEQAWGASLPELAGLGQRPRHHSLDTACGATAQAAVDQSSVLEPDENY